MRLRRYIIRQCNRASLHFLFFSDRYGPLAVTLLLALDEVAFVDASFEAYELAVALRLAIFEVANEAASIFVDLDACAVFEAIFELSFIDVTCVRLQNAVAPRLIVRPHATVVENRVLLRPSAVTMTHALIPLARVSLFGHILDHFALALPLVLDKAAHEDIFVLVDLVTSALSLILHPFALIQRDDLIQRNAFLAILLCQFVC